MISLLFTFIGIIVFLSQSRKNQFYIFSLSAFFQFTLGNLGSVPKFLLIEWITPIFFLILINEIISLKIRRREKIVDYRGGEVFIFGLILLLISTGVSYANNEIFAPYSHYSSGKGIIRMYYGIVNNTLIFFTTTIYFAKNFKDIDIDKLIKLLLVTSVSLGLLRIASYFFDVSIPFMAGGFDYNPTASSRYGGTAYRIGGLGEATLVGFSALFANFYLRKKLNIFYALCLLIIQFMSGGRTMLAAIVVAVAIYSTFFLKKTFRYLILLGMVGSIVIILIIPQKVVEGQIGRMTAFQSGAEQQEQIRLPGYAILFNSFKKNPIFGKGISEYNGIIFGINESAQESIRSLIYGGGHGSYISMLGIFGIAGLLFFLIMIYGTIFLAFKKIKKYFDSNEQICALATFIFVLGLMCSIYLVSSYNGYGISYLFFNMALAVSIRVNENLNNIPVKA